jgi:uroporphyrinogen-III synthase
VTGALAGRRIVVTRPANQAQALAQMIAASGGEAIVFPAIEIRALEDTAALDAAIDRLEELDLAVFVSPNAVEQAMRRVLGRRTWPAHVAVATIGSGSESALRARGFSDVIAPAEQFDSEGLLALLPPTWAEGKNILIFRGDTGRELLGDVLSARGATVRYVACYSRVCPAADPRPLIEAWSTVRLHAVTATSSEGLRNFSSMIGVRGRTYLRQTPVFVPHPRIAACARSLALTHVIETSAGDAGLIAGLEAFFATDDAP